MVQELVQPQILPTLLVFDDTPAEISEHVRIAEDMGFHVRVASKVAEVAAEIAMLNAPALAMLDEHARGVNDLREAGDIYRRLKTEKGTRVGYTIATGLLPDLNVPHILEVYVTSQRDLTEKASEEVKQRVRRGTIGGFFKKTDLESFRSIAERYLERLDLTEHPDAPQVSSAPLESDPVIERDSPDLTDGRDVATEMFLRPKGPDMEVPERHLQRVNAAKKMVSEWASGNYSEVMAVFGSPGVPNTSWPVFERSLVDIYRADTALRADLIIEIKRALRVIYGEATSIEKEIAYLNAKDEFLGGDAPWGCMLRGHMKDLARVTAFMGQVF